ncbi:MAG: hypothetical protein K2K82_08615 [Muribaculaceae bacterium]|nr:hypothetical protein [Muribaculaceae bacterium]
MKKLLLLACGLLISGAAFAQEQVLKEAERALKVEVPDHGKIANMLKGAMADPTTANNVKTWFLAGKNGFQTWQTGYEQYMQGAPLDNANKANMSRALVEGYSYLLKALPMDTIIDAKGKVKTKYSKDIVKLISSNPGSFHDAGVFLYESNDLAGAYHAWEIYQELPTLTFLGKSAPKFDADSIRAQDYYNMGIFALQAEMKPESMMSFLNAARLGYGDVAYDNALALASEVKDRDMIIEIANEAFAKYGKQNYIAALINLFIQDKEYDKALQMLNTAIETNPGSAVLYNAKGILVEDQVNNEGVTPEVVEAANAEALELYKTATEVEPNNAEAHYHYGRMLANKAYTMSDNATDLSVAEYNNLKKETLDPLFRQAAGELEKCIAIDKEANRQAFSILKNIYYNLNDEANMNRITDLELE